MSLGFEEPVIYTTDATETSLFTMSVQTDKQVSFKGEVKAEDAAGNSYYARFAGCVQNKSGTCSLVMSEVVDAPDNLACACEIDADDTAKTARVRVTGIVATSITWRGYIWTTAE